MINSAKRLIVALDMKDETEALRLVEELVPKVQQFKVGMALFYSAGPQIVEAIHRRGADVFLDLKLHDIPNTVEGAGHALAQRKVWMTNVHASGGVEMMKAARRALPDTILLAVTVLTSWQQDDFNDFLGISGSIETTVEQWSRAAQKAGLDGVVCSPEEIRTVREALGPEFLIVTPGIRPEWAAADDQKRIMTPARAVALGSDYLVIGRPITKADDPGRAVERIIGALRDEDEKGVDSFDE